MKLKDLLLLLGVVNGLLVGSSNLFAQDSQSVNLAWDASPSPSVTSYVVYHGNASGSYANLTNVGNQATARINELQAGQTYFFAVTALDDAGVESLPSNEISYLVPVIDPPPTIALTAPANNATVSDSAVTVSANATDNVGVAGVQFKLNGANLGAEDTSAPYSVTWNTTSVADGTHTLTAVARDAAGNQATSMPLSVIVSNSAPVTPPTVTVVASDANASRVGPDNGALTIARTGSTTSSLTVNYSLGGTAVNGTDYETLNTSLTMPVGAASATLTVVPKSSVTHVDAKTATLTLVANSAYTVGTSGSASVKIAGNSVPISLKLTGKNATISWGSIAGRTYLVAYKANLSDANWTDLSGDITATSTSTSWSDPEGSRFNQRYYTVYVTN